MWTRAALVLLCIGPLGVAASRSSASRPGINKLACGAYGTAQTDTTYTTPTRAQRLILGRVWLPKASTLLRWPRKANLNGPDLFIKYGIVVSVGSPVTLRVPPSAQEVYALNFANPESSIAKSKSSVRVAPCPRRDGAATAWPGGYLVSQPACVPLLITVDGRSTRISLSLGRRCN